MASLSLKIDGLNTTLNKIRDLEKITQKEVVKELNTFGLKTVAEAKRLAPVDEGFLRNSIASEVTVSGNEIKCEVSVNADYAAYVEFGTKKFAAAYVSSLPADWQTYAATFKGKGRGGSFNDFVLKLVKWVSKKQIGVTYSVSSRRKNRQTKDEKYQIAYAIALKILREGIRQHPFLFPAYNNQSKALIERLKTLFK